MGKIKHRRLLPGADSLPLFTPPPPPGNGFWRKVYGEISCSQTYLLLSDYLVSLEHHYADGNTIPCLRLLYGDCKHCDTCRRTWAAYACGWDGNQREKVLICLTENSVRNCPRLTSKTSLAGHTITIVRTKGHRRGPVRASVSEGLAHNIEQRRVVTAERVRRHVLWMWGFCLDDGAELPATDQT